MGLDMYLNAEKYLSEYDEDSKKVANEIAAIEISGTKGFRVKGVEIALAYWRKANHIHKWFVSNVQDGVDECQRADVSREDLRDLLALCKQVVKDPIQAEELLPWGGGFFFGGTEYDEYYFKDLEYTIKTIEKVLAEVGSEWDIYYRSSW